MSEMLEKARNYETEKQVYVKKTTKPLFHVTAPTGWINDPNGFSVYDGKIHLFYQYNPYQREWGPMHWGHSVTDDMVRWEQLPAAIAPDQEYDKAGCFSGSAIEADGKHVLVYTGVTRVKQADGSEQERQNQCIAFGDTSLPIKIQPQFLILLITPCHFQNCLIICPFFFLHDECSIRSSKQSICARNHIKTI